MKVKEVEACNELARTQITNFEKTVCDKNIGIIDENFHKFKDAFPFFGNVPVVIDSTEFTMYCGNDDLVALTYFWYGHDSYESHSLKMWLDLAKNASFVFDIGAFTGVYALSAAVSQNNARIYAFEPSRRTHGRLFLNIRMNGLQGRVHPINWAVSDKTSTTKLYQFRGPKILGNGAAILEKPLKVFDDTEIVPTVSIDEYCANENLRPDLIKIDVESAEVLVLEGAANTIECEKPTMLIEVTPQTAAAVKSKFDHFGYTAKAIDDQTGEMISFDGKVPKVVNVLAERK